ncbi:Mu transposase C-terminal domain-containing protein [Paenibacillus abyssi]|uniref:Integrase catalytic domain-containing protein n=1 Tax=Paenibacillus abyssi TaxID=1340531 RepID=A0A917D1L3_9BACL|nr:Mu transposase C-terminal domain-containing protein [Paenibacillus abyssi]GGG07672.1 hypothetical protein GCM10010916_25700 [Paenibacillus abyssi]
MIAAGNLIEWIETDYMERVLWVDSHYKECYVIRLNPLGEEQVYFPVLRQVKALTSALEEGQAIVRPVDPYMNFPVPSPDNTQAYEDRDKAWELIKDLVKDVPDIYDKTLRWAALQDRMDESGATAKTYYKYLRRYWAGGMTEAALFHAHDRKGGKGKKKSADGSKRGRPSRVSKTLGIMTGVNITEEIEAIFSLAIKVFYNPRKPKSLPKAYKDMIDEWFSIGDITDRDGNKIPLLPSEEELPTFASFKSWYYRSYNTRERLIAKEGKRAFNLKHRPLLSSTKDMHFGPGAIYQVDATIADIYLVSRFDRTRLIGRPVIYVIVDGFSRLIPGFYVGLEGPSWTGARMALANAFEDKVEFCARYGITITKDQWPCQHVPKAILADNGELKSKASDNVVSGLGITLLNAAPFRADWKGIVEQTFNLLNVNAIKWAPGAVHKRERERGEKDHRLDGKLTLEEFTAYMIQTVLEHNQEKYMDYYGLDSDMVAQHVSPYPLDLWNWGIQNRGGILRAFPPDYIRYHLMPKEEATVTREGIRFEGMFYSCDTAMREAWFEQAASTGVWKVPISYDFRSTNAIYLPAENGQGFERCELTPKSEELYKNKTIEEATDYNEIAKLNRDLAGPRKMQSQTEYNAKRQAIIEKATKRTDEELKQSDKSNNERTKEIRNNRREEKELNRLAERHDIGKKPPLENPARVIEMPRKEDGPSSELRPKTTKRDSFLDILDEEEH